jgi:hypothetical protein
MGAPWKQRIKVKLKRSKTKTKKYFEVGEGNSAGNNVSNLIGVINQPFRSKKYVLVSKRFWSRLLFVRQVNARNGHISIFPISVFVILNIRTKASGVYETSLLRYLLELSIIRNAQLIYIWSPQEYFRPGQRVFSLICYRRKTISLWRNRLIFLHCLRLYSVQWFSCRSLPRAEVCCFGIS